MPELRVGLSFRKIVIRKHVVIEVGGTDAHAKVTDANSVTVTREQFPDKFRTRIRRQTMDKIGASAGEGVSETIDSLKGLCCVNFDDRSGILFILESEVFLLLQQSSLVAGCQPLSNATLRF